MRALLVACQRAGVRVEAGQGVDGFDIRVAASNMSPRETIRVLRRRPTSWRQDAGQAKRPGAWD